MVAELSGFAVIVASSAVDSTNVHRIAVFVVIALALMTRIAEFVVLWRIFPHLGWGAPVACVVLLFGIVPLLYTAGIAKRHLRAAGIRVRFFGTTLPAVPPGGLAPG